jgi:uncharacterized Rmd1/YagE family protein
MIRARNNKEQKKRQSSNMQLKMKSIRTSCGADGYNLRKLKLPPKAKPSQMRDESRE